MPRQKNIHSQNIYDLQAHICAALAHPVRLQILDLLSEGEKTSTDLLKVLKLPKANMSQHLAVLKEAGIIQSRREKTYQYLSLSLPKIKEACLMVRSVLVEKIGLEEKKRIELVQELQRKKGGR